MAITSEVLSIYSKWSLKSNPIAAVKKCSNAVAQSTSKCNRRIQSTIADIYKYYVRQSSIKTSLRSSFLALSSSSRLLKNRKRRRLCVALGYDSRRFPSWTPLDLITQQLRGSSASNRLPNIIKAITHYMVQCEAELYTRRFKPKLMPFEAIIN